MKPTPSSAIPTLSVLDVARSRDARDLLSGASMEIAPGSMVALLGPNGAGKTSLLRAIAGRLRLDRGEVRIAGRTPAQATRQGLLGVVPQDIALYPHLTIRENLTAFGRLAGVPASALQARVHEGLEWAGLADRSATLVTTLSGGMRRRVNLVAGTLHHPALLLLDEPTVGVDVEARSRLHTLLSGLGARGMSLLIATHDVDEAASLCDAVAVMWAGRVVASGPNAQLIADVFLGRREITLRVAEPVPTAAGAVLGERGFQPDGRGSWTMLAADTGTPLHQLEERVLQAGGRLLEIRIAEPSLAGAVAWHLREAVRDRAA